MNKLESIVFLLIAIAGIMFAFLLTGCTTQSTQPVQSIHNQASGIVVDTTLCCPPGYRCTYRPDLGLNHYGSYWWCVSGIYAGEPTKCN